MNLTFLFFLCSSFPFFFPRFFFFQKTKDCKAACWWETIIAFLLFFSTSYKCVHTFGPTHTMVRHTKSNAIGSLATAVLEIVETIWPFFWYQWLGSNSTSIGGNHFQFSRFICDSVANFGAAVVWQQNTKVSRDFLKKRSPLMRNKVENLFFFFS